MTARHTLVFFLNDGAPEFRIECDWPEDDPTRPCRAFSCDGWEDPDHEHDETCKPIEGCSVIEWLDAGGYEAITAEGFEARIPSALFWHAEGWPILKPHGGAS